MSDYEDESSDIEYENNSQPKNLDNGKIDKDYYESEEDYENISVNGDLKNEMGKGKKKDNSYLITIGIIIAVIIVALIAYWLYKRKTS